jgi:hypothetical protein
MTNNIFEQEWGDLFDSPTLDNDLQYFKYLSEVVGKLNIVGYSYWADVMTPQEYFDGIKRPLKQNDNDTAPNSPTAS